MNLFRLPAMFFLGLVGVVSPAEELMRIPTGEKGTDAI